MLRYWLNKNVYNYLNLIRNNQEFHNKHHSACSIFDHKGKSNEHIYHEPESTTDPEGIQTAG